MYARTPQEFEILVSFLIVEKIDNYDSPDVRTFTRQSKEIAKRNPAT